MNIYLRMLWDWFFEYVFLHLPRGLGSWMFWRSRWTKEVYLWLAIQADSWGEAKLHAEVMGLPNRLAAYREWDERKRAAEALK